MSDKQVWLELAVVAEQEAVEPVTELFVRYGYNNGVVIEEQITPGKDGGAEIDHAAPVVIRTYVPVTPDPSQPEGYAPPENLQKVREGLYFLGRMLRIEDLKVEVRQEEDWANAWKEFYQVHRVGKRTVIKPPWQDYLPEPDDIVIEIDPGMAFGTGLHPTTRLCLLALEDYFSVLREGVIVLDLGTGSGILAFAAAKLGAEKVIAVDTDAVAVNSAQENSERNGLQAKIVAAQGSLAIETGATIEGGFYSFREEDQRTPPELAAVLPVDLIIANIIARIIAALAVAMYHALKPGGTLICSGIIEERAGETLAALQTAGLTLLERKQEGDWVAFVLRK
jgi:ribosomal protein L11 methyltransferase